MELNARGHDYKLHKGTKCTCCPAEADLTVHHKIPQSILRIYGIDKIDSKDLETLCSPCHERYTLRENSVKSQFGRAITPFYNLEVERLLNLIHSSHKSMKNDTMAKALLGLGLFFKRAIDKEEALLLAKENWKNEKDIPNVYTYKQMVAFWKHHFATWKKEQLMFAKMKQYSEEHL
jgi:hypothetical protein